VLFEPIGVTLGYAVMIERRERESENGSEGREKLTKVVNRQLCLSL
jgi:hypothetical protein